MNFWSALSAPLNKIVDSIGNAIDKNVTNDEERLIQKNELMRILTEAEQKANEVEQQLEQELSKRHQTDMTSDNKLSKNIRPLLLLFLTAVVTILALTDGNIQIGNFVFTIKESWVTLFTSSYIAAITFYFGFRSYDKKQRIKGNNNER